MTPCPLVPADPVVPPPGAARPRPAVTAADVRRPPRIPRGRFLSAFLVLSFFPAVAAAADLGPVTIGRAAFTAGTRVRYADFVRVAFPDPAAVASVAFTLDGVPLPVFETAEGGWAGYLDPSVLGEGPHVFGVAATDAAGGATETSIPFRAAFDDPLVGGRKRMGTGQSQTLTILNYRAGTSYDWRIVSGGGVLGDPVENRVVYTAPAANPGCAPPTVAVTDAEGRTGAITIAVNNDTVEGRAYGLKTQIGPCTNGVSSGREITMVTMNVKTYTCRGEKLRCEENGLVDVEGHLCDTPGGVCDCGTRVCEENVRTRACYPFDGMERLANRPCGRVVDIRSEAMIAAGCCPEALLEDDGHNDREEAPEDSDEGRGPCENCPTCAIDRVGNPVSVLNGNNHESEEDIRIPGAGAPPLTFTRFYNSRATASGPLGAGWRHTYQAGLTPEVTHNGSAYLKIRDASGRGVYFRFVGDDRFVGAFGERTAVRSTADAYLWQRRDGRVFRFDREGRLRVIADAEGRRQTLGYDGDRLETVSDGSRELTFDYNAAGMIAAVRGPRTAAVPDGVWVAYGYDNGRLAETVYADGSGFAYAYEDPNPGEPNNLTAKSDRLGRLVASWAYDSLDRAVESWSRDGGGVAITYENENLVRVTDAYGVARDYTLHRIDGRRRVTAVTGGDGCAACGGHVTRVSHDRALRVTEVAYANGRVDRYADHDGRGNARTIVEAAGTPEARVVACAYHPVSGALLSRREAGVLATGFKATVWDYEDDGWAGEPNEDTEHLSPRIHRRIEEGFTMDVDGGVRPYRYETRYTYTAEGRIAAVDGPLAGDEDAVRYAYHPDGALHTVTRVRDETTTYADYEAGRPKTVIDPGGVVTRYTYDARGRVLTVTRP